MASDSPARFVTTQLSESYYLAPDGSEIRLLSEACRGGAAHCTLPATGVSKAVRHQTVEEIWHCLSGNGQIWRKLGDAEAITDLQAGVSLTIPVGAHFQFRNTGAGPLCLLIITMPPWPGSSEAVHVADHWETT
jgi:mannose-6-phosphate isomerase-like protein (cupin superfamily)